MGRYLGVCTWLNTVDRELSVALLGGLTVSADTLITVGSFAMPVGSAPTDELNYALVANHSWSASTTASVDGPVWLLEEVAGVWQWRQLAANEEFNLAPGGGALLRW